MAEQLRFRVQGTGETIAFEPRLALIVGYAGRDQEAVRRHVKELAEQGIPAPASTPSLYIVTTDRLTQQHDLTVPGPRACGEAECVLVLHGGEVYVGIGSDHTDRELEQQDIAAAKQLCPKPVGSELWRLSEVLDYWDELELRSWVGEEQRLYQQGTVASLLRPEDILAFVRGEAGQGIQDAAIYCGTLPMLGGVFTTEPSFIAELRDPRTGRALRCAYRTQIADSENANPVSPA